MTDISFKIERLKTRPQFLLAAAKGVSKASGAVVIQARDRGDGGAVVRAGFTATKRIGGAVTRNRAKRRLREAARAILSQHGTPGFDYVFIARQGTADRPWPRLLDDMKSALIRLAPSSGPARAPSAAPSEPDAPRTPPFDPSGQDR